MLRETADGLAWLCRPAPERRRDVRYRLHSPEGDDLGEAVYAQMIYPGEEIIGGDAQRFRVLDVVPLDEEDESPFAGLLRVVAA